MSASLDQVRSKVQTILTEHFPVGLDREGDFTIRYESAQGWVRCWEKAEESYHNTFVRIEAPLLFGVKESPELYKYVATHSDDYVFGHLWCQQTSEGVLVMFTHTLLGDYLDEDELVQAVIVIVGSGNDLDDELQGMFGGQRFIDA